MKNDKIIIILSIVIIILVVIIGIFLFNANFTKEDTNIILSGNSTLYKGEPLTIKLTDKDGNGIGNQNITVTLTDSNGSIEEYNTITDSDGEGKIAINVNNSGQYTANIKYNGNNKYKESSITQGITIKDIVGNIQNALVYAIYKLGFISVVYRSFRPYGISIIIIYFMISIT